MKMQIFLIVALCILPMVLSAQNDKAELELKMTSKGFPYVECNLEQFGSLYNLSKTFSIPLDRILDANGIKDATQVSADRILKVPINTDLIKNNGSKGLVKLYYTVQAGETLYRISKSYFKREVKDVMALNGMDDNQLQLGKRMLIGYYLAETSPEEAAEIANAVEEDDSISGPPVVWIKARGIALWNQVQTRSGKRFVLHSSAKLNTEIELYNPLMRRTIKAKVVGRIPAGTYAKDIDVILSSATASALGALDARFMVDMRYVQAEESLSAAMR